MIPTQDVARRGLVDEEGTGSGLFVGDRPVTSPWCLDHRGWPAPNCLAAEHCWDPVHWVIKEHGWRFERLKSGRAVTVIAAANGS